MCKHNDVVNAVPIVTRLRNGSAWISIFSVSSDFRSEKEQNTLHLLLSGKQIKSLYDRLDAVLKADDQATFEDRDYEVPINCVALSGGADGGRDRCWSG